MISNDDIYTLELTRLEVCDIERALTCIATEHAIEAKADGTNGDRRKICENTAAFWRRLHDKIETQLDEQDKNAERVTIDSNIKAWYRRAYPTDELGMELNYHKTFKDILQALVNGKNIYLELGAGDSIIRERVFTELAELCGVEYNTIYTMWTNDELARLVKMTTEKSFENS